MCFLCFRYSHLCIYFSQYWKKKSSLRSIPGLSHFIVCLFYLSLGSVSPTRACFIYSFAPSLAIHDNKRNSIFEFTICWEFVGVYIHFRDQFTIGSVYMANIILLNSMFSRHVEIKCTNGEIERGLAATRSGRHHKEKNVKWTINWKTN